MSSDVPSVSGGDRDGDDSRWSSDAGDETQSSASTSTPDPRWSSDAGDETQGSTGSSAPDPRWSSDGGDETQGSTGSSAPGSRWPDVLVVVGLTLLAALAAALGFFHLAWRWGTAAVPISPLVLAVIVWVLCRAAFRLTGALRMAALPWVGCLVVIALLYFAGNSHWPLPLRVVTMDYATNQATDGNWRGYLLLGVPVLTAAVQLSLLWATSVSARAERPQDPPLPTGSGTVVGAGPVPQYVTPTTSGPSRDSSAPTGVDTGP